MNNCIKNKIKNKIKEISNNKKEYFTFCSTKITSLEKEIENKSIGALYLSEEENEIIRDLKIKLKEEKEKFQIKDSFFDLIDFSNEIYLKNNKFNFLNLEVSLSDNYLLIKSKENYNYLYLSLNQGIIISITKNNEISIKNNDLKETLKIRNMKAEYKGSMDVKLEVEKKEFLKLFVEIINIILMNKSIY